MQKPKVRFQIRFHFQIRFQFEVVLSIITMFCFSSFNTACTTSSSTSSSAERTDPLVERAQSQLENPVQIKNPFVWHVFKQNPKSDDHSAFQEAPVVHTFIGTIHAGVSSNQLAPEIHEKARNSDVFISELGTALFQDPQETANTISKVITESIANQLSYIRSHNKSPIRSDKEQRNSSAIISFTTREQHVLTQTLGREVAKNAPRMPAWYTCLSLMQQLSAPRLGVETDKASESETLSEPALGMDIGLTLIARSSQKKIIALETIEDQIRILATDDFCSENDLKELLKNPQKMHDDFEELQKVYLTGNEELMAQKLTEFAEMSLSLQSSLLVERNHAWIEILEKEFNNGECFVAVGLAHLIGEESVLEILTKKGYTVERITPERL